MSSSRSTDQRERLPLWIDGVDLRCLIVGGGSVATRRAERLLAAGARVEIIAPRITAQLERVLGARCRLSRREFESRDLDGVGLVVVATDDEEVNRRVVEEARDRGLLVNAAFDSSEGNVFFSGTRAMGEVQISCVVGEGNPVASRMILDRIIRDHERSFEQLARILSQLRSLVKQRGEPPERMTSLDGEALIDAIEANDPEAIRELLARNFPAELVAQLDFSPPAD